MLKLSGLVAKLLLMATIVFAGIAMAPSESSAQGNFGLGFILGNPSGLTGKYWIGKKNAIDFHLGIHNYGYRNNGSAIGLYGDYLFNYPIASNSVAEIPFYLGPGVGLVIQDNDYYRDNRDRNCDRNERNCFYDDGNDEIWLSARMPIGVAFLFKKFPGELFLELTPHIWIIQHIDFDIGGALGFRFYF